MYVHSDELEGAFSAFLDSEAYDRTEGALFDLMRAAFIAGWQGAWLQYQREKQEKGTERAE